LPKTGRGFLFYGFTKITEGIEMKKIFLPILISVFVAGFLNFQAAAWVLEDAEDGDTEGWSVSDNTPEGAAVSNIYDEDKQSRVIKLVAPGGISNCFAFTFRRDNANFRMQLDLNHYDAATTYCIYVRLRLKTGEVGYMKYIPNGNISQSTIQSGAFYIVHSLDTATSNGQWHTITRELEEDVKAASGVPGFEGFEDKEIMYVEGVSIRGNCMLDNMTLSESLTPVESILRFQGILKDSVGIIDGTRDLTFRLYESDGAGATVVWEELHENVLIENGLVDVELGGGTSLEDLKFDRQYWLGVEISGDEQELSPRFKLTTMPYLINANN
jgi:hypothetical protein